MDVLPDVWAWAEQNFGAADLGDRRRTRRLVQSAAKIAAQPEKPFTQVFDWNDLRGFYRLCDQSEASLAAVMSPHWQQTRQAMSRQPLVLILHDTTELDYSSHHHLSGAGQIGNQYGQGFFQHNSLAVLPQPRQVLGLTYQQLQVRQPAPEGETSHQRKRRVCESVWWLDGYRGAGEAPDGCCWVDVCDRGGDDYEGMCVARDLKHHFLFRARHNRLVYTTAQQDEQEYLFDLVHSLPSQGQDVVEIPGRGGRAERKAHVALAAAPVWIPPPKDTPRPAQRPILAAWVIRIWEPEPPADTEALEWILLCSLPTTTLEELKERRDWYCCRWLIEVFHHIEKNGCSEEDRRFETADRLETCLAILSVVAVRVFQMRCALEHQPNEPATCAGTAEEIRLIGRFLKQKKKLTVRDFVRGVAKLGGFLGRKGDGEPGVRTLWRGYQRLQDMIFGLHLCNSTTAGPR